MINLAFLKETSWLVERLKAVYNTEVDRGVGECESVRKGLTDLFLCCENKDAHQTAWLEMSLPERERTKETETRAWVPFLHVIINCRL